MTVPEGGTAAYTVKLATKPSGTVLVTVARKSSGQQDTDLSVKTGASLYFSPQTWDTPLYVFLQADDDTDALHGTAVFVHTASGADYGSVSKELTATEADDEVALVLSKTEVRVPEGATATYTVKLKSLPTASVTVTVARKSGGDTNLTADTDSVAGGDQSTLTFTTTDWNTAQTVTLASADDTDDDNGRAVFTHTASGGQYTGARAALTAIEAENECGMTISPADVLKVPEASGWAYYRIKLNTQPSADVTVTMAKTGDTNLAHVIGTPMTFTMTNWNEWQTRPVSASADDDDVDGTATLTHTAIGGGYVNVTAALTPMEVDKDRKFFGVSDSQQAHRGRRERSHRGPRSVPQGPRHPADHARRRCRRRGLDPRRDRSRHERLRLGPRLHRLGRPVARQQRERRQAALRGKPQGLEAPAGHPGRGRPCRNPHQPLPVPRLQAGRRRHRPQDGPDPLRHGARRHAVSRSRHRLRGPSGQPKRRALAAPARQVRHPGREPCGSTGTP